MDALVEQPVVNVAEWKLPSIRRVGIICLIATESALFSIFVVAFVFYMGRSLNPPYPSELFPFPSGFPWLGSIALFGSSGTIVVAEHMLARGNKHGFHLWWAITIALGLYFLYFTGNEWLHLIHSEHLTISTNVFGTTFYSLVGLHASHVLVGAILLGIVFVASVRGKVDHEHHEHVEAVSWYWHFVDAIWLVVVTLVYIISPRIQ